MTVAEFKAAMPAFATTADPEIQAALDLADPHFDVERWDTLFTEGYTNWVAHQIIVNAPAAAGDNALAGDTTEEHVGKVGFSRSADIALRVMGDPMLSTRYGQRYAYLAARIGSGGTAA